MDIIKAVKKLGNKLTGETYTSKDLVKLIDEIADDYSGGGGGGGGIVILNATKVDDELVLDKTYAEIFAIIADTPVFVKATNVNYDSQNMMDCVTDAHFDSLDYTVATFTNSFTASSENDYPSCYLG